MQMLVDGDMRDVGQDVPPAAVGGCSRLITDEADEQPSNANNDADQAQPITDSSTADDDDEEVGSKPRRDSSSSGESLEAFVAEAEHECEDLAQDVLRGGGNDGDGEGNATTSFDNSVEDASGLCSLRAELAQATPEEAGVVLIEGGGNDDDDSSSSSSSSIGGGSTCFGVATPKAERHHASAASNVEQGDGSSGQNAAGRGRTSPKRRRSPVTGSSWLRLTGMNSNVSTRSAAGAATNTGGEDAGPPSLAQPLTALDHVLLEDMTEDDIGVEYERFRSKDAPQALEDVSVQSRALAAGAEVGAAAAARDDSSSMVTTSQFLHPLHNGQNEDDGNTTHTEKTSSAKWSLSTRRPSDDHKARRDSFGARQLSRRTSDERSKHSLASSPADSASKAPGLLILGDLATSLSTLGGGGDDNTQSVSTIASSMHSGAVVAKQRSKISLLNEKLDAKLKSKVGRRRLLYEDEYYHDEDDIDWQLEEDFFAEEDAMNIDILREAHEVMAQVNKSVSSLGVDPPFRPTEDIIPRIEHLHASLKFQLLHSKAAGIVEEAKGPKSDPESSLETSNVSESIENSCANASSPAKAVALPPLDNREALVKFFMQRMREASLKDVQSKSHPSSGTQEGRSEQGPLGYQQFTAFLPNFLWYQPKSDDTSNIIRPTSLCSGTGIGSGLKYIDPEMMAIFALFGSYFAGALSEADEMTASLNGREDENFSTRRSARWLTTIGEDSDSESEDESVQIPEDGTLEAGGDLNTEKANGMVFSDAQMELIQNAIEELLSKQIHSFKPPEKDGGLTSDKENVQGANEVKLENVGDDGDSSDYHSADEGADSDEDKDADGFFVGFPQN